MKKKMNSQLMGIAIIAIMSTLILMIAVCFSVIKNQVIEDLRDYGSMAEEVLQTEEIEEAYAILQNQAAVRVTIVAEDGTVLFDNRTMIETMGNHAARPEIVQAKESGEGISIRKSDTLHAYTFYLALEQPDQTVIRVAKDVGSVYTVAKLALGGAGIVLLVLLAVSAVITHFFTRSLLRPIEQMAMSGEVPEQENQSAGDAAIYKEMQPFLEAINSRHETIMENAKMRQEFTANVSHELKTPLTAISGYAELIEKGMVSSTDDIQRFSKEIHSNANRLLTLINDVIRLSELDAEGPEEEFAVVNLYDIAETCVNMLQINAEKRNVTITLQGENAYILSTRQMMEELLYNLCDNAIRYNVENGSVTVSVLDRLDTVVLSVKDTGIGISKEHQERIFERFYRVDKSRSKLTGGTGLGLAIVKHILMRHEVTPVVISNVGEGTEIKVVFPAVRK